MVSDTTGVHSPILVYFYFVELLQCFKDYDIGCHVKTKSTRAMGFAYALTLLFPSLWGLLKAPNRYDNVAKNTHWNSMRKRLDVESRVFTVNFFLMWCRRHQVNHLRLDGRVDFDVEWKHFRCYWHFVRGIHRSPVDSPHKAPVTLTRTFDVPLLLVKRLNKHSIDR